ncbi:XAC0095 family protein [Lysobacter terrae]
MEKAPRNTMRMAYQLPEEEYRALIQAHDQLRLLAQLSEPYTFTECAELPLSRYALAHCFDRLAGELDDIVRGAWWPGE